MNKIYFINLKKIYMIGYMIILFNANECWIVFKILL